MMTKAFAVVEIHEDAALLPDRGIEGSGHPACPGWGRPVRGSPVLQQPRATEPNPVNHLFTLLTTYQQSDLTEKVTLRCNGRDRPNEYAIEVKVESKSDK